MRRPALPMAAREGGDRPGPPSSSSTAPSTGSRTQPRPMAPPRPLPLQALILVTEGTFLDLSGSSYGQHPGATRGVGTAERGLAQMLRVSILMADVALFVSSMHPQIRCSHLMPLLLLLFSHYGSVYNALLTLGFHDRNKCVFFLCVVFVFAFLK